MSYRVARAKSPNKFILLDLQNPHIVSKKGANVAPKLYSMLASYSIVRMCHFVQIKRHPFSDYPDTLNLLSRIKTISK